MNKIYSLLIILAGLLPVLHAEEKKRMPNLIILLADDLGYGELGCQGNKEIPTPHIDGMPKRAFASLRAMSPLPTAVPPGRSDNRKIWNPLWS